MIPQNKLDTRAGMPYIASRHLRLDRLQHDSHCSTTLLMRTKETRTRRKNKPDTRAAAAAQLCVLAHLSRNTIKSGGKRHRESSRRFFWYGMIERKPIQLPIWVVRPKGDGLCGRHGYASGCATARNVSLLERALRIKWPNGAQYPDRLLAERGIGSG